MVDRPSGPHRANEMFTIQPAPWARIPSSAWSARSHAAHTFTSTCSRKLAAVIRSNVSSKCRAAAALFTRMSTGSPNASAVARTISPRSKSTSARSATTGMAAPPADRIESTVSSNEPSYTPSPGLSVRAVTATRAPSAARRWAMARPIPRLAPVTIATRPSHALPTWSPVVVHPGTLAVSQSSTIRPTCRCSGASRMPTRTSVRLATNVASSSSGSAARLDGAGAFGHGDRHQHDQLDDPLAPHRRREVGRPFLEDAEDLAAGRDRCPEFGPAATC